MISTHVKFEAKFPYGCCIYNELHKVFKFQGQIDLEGQGQGHQFSITSEILR